MTKASAELEALREAADKLKYWQKRVGVLMGRASLAGCSPQEMAESVGWTEEQVRQALEPPGLRLEVEKERLPAGWGVARIDGRVVTPAEARSALAVLEIFNEEASKASSRPVKFRSRDYLRAIVMRLREHPEISLDEHRLTVRIALQHPWWRGSAHPAVVYGTRNVFERSFNDRHAADLSIYDRD